MAAISSGQRRYNEKDTPMASKDDIRDNVVHYDDEGGGEADTRAFDMSALRSTHSQSSGAHSEKNGYGDRVLLHLGSRCHDVRSPDVHRQTAGVTEGGTDAVKEFVAKRLESQRGDAVPPYDSLATCEGWVAGSLSSIGDSWVIDDTGDFSSLGDWGQPFKTLASLLDGAVAEES